MLDQRATPAQGRINEPEDIIGTIMVRDGEIIQGTYEPMPSHRLVTADGPVWLSEGIQEELVNMLGRITEEERKLRYSRCNLHSMKGAEEYCWSWLAGSLCSEF